MCISCVLYSLIRTVTELQPSMNLLFCNGLLYFCFYFWLCFMNTHINNWHIKLDIPSILHAASLFWFRVVHTYISIYSGFVYLARILLLKMEKEIISSLYLIWILVPVCWLELAILKIKFNCKQLIPFIKISIIHQGQKVGSITSH
jgi:hypothetical protein